MESHGSRFKADHIYDRDVIYDQKTHSFYPAAVRAGQRRAHFHLDAVLERGVLRVGFDAGYQPFEMTNKQGQYIGFDVDLAKMVAKEMGVKVEFVNTAWDGIIPALLTDKFDVIMGGMTVTPQRNLRVNFADPYIVVGQTIVLRKDKAGEIKSFRTSTIPNTRSRSNSAPPASKRSSADPQGHPAAV
jgi:polar amino acid transport system substrate-binding protein